MTEILDPSAWAKPEVIVGIAALVATLVTLWYVRRADRALIQQNLPAVSARTFMPREDGWIACEVTIRYPGQHIVAITEIRPARPWRTLMSPNADGMSPRPDKPVRYLKPDGWEVTPGGLSVPQIVRVFFFKLPRPDMPVKATFRFKGVKRDSRNRRFSIRVEAREP